MNESMCRGIDKAKRRSETDKRWYYVPPYKKSEGEIVVNADGEQVAVFEMKEDALKCVNAHNKCIES